jgi:hypothetical protein
MGTESMDTVAACAGVILSSLLEKRKTAPTMAGVTRKLKSCTSCTTPQKKTNNTQTASQSAQHPYGHVLEFLTFLSRMLLMVFFCFRFVCCVDNKFLLGEKLFFFT